MILGVRLALDETGHHGTVDKTDRTVLSHEQVIGHITNGGRSAGVPADGEEQLVLAGGDPSLQSVLLAPPQKAPQAITKLEQLLVIGVRQ
ncbi:MAG: hypothetical protein QOG03_997, partial [Actinomycetota bacterium]|nr:hypothetical protein [Actinomycetota bacterium]